MMKREYKRRDFIKDGFATALGLSSMMGLLSLGEKLNAYSGDDDYKAIVCVLLEGGADVFNMIAPLQNQSYKNYQAMRENIALSQDSLLKINNEYGFRENMQDMQKLFLDKHLAIISSVGTLVEPITAQEAKDGSKQVPFELFAHNTQRDQWMLGDATGSSKNGWGARVADSLYKDDNSSRAYANINSADVNTLLLSGGKEEPLSFDDAYIPADTMQSYGFGPESGGSDLGNVYQNLYQMQTNSQNRLLKAFAKKRIKELNLPYKLENLFDGVREFDNFSMGVHEVGKPLGKQLEIVAKILSVKDNFPANPKRQIFFVNHHGWDTHDSDNEHQVGYLSESLGAFWNALESLGISNSVTTFTISDFGRSISANGAGTDHGWGTHAFVMGGAVKGGQIYGDMPLIQKDSPDFWYERLVPKIAMESYLSPIIKWFGATKSDLAQIFPNLHKFQDRNLKFMG